MLVERFFRLLLAAKEFGSVLAQQFETGIAEHSFERGIDVVARCLANR